MTRRPETIDRSDYETWKANFGDDRRQAAARHASQALAVPEPATATMLLLAAGLVVGFAAH